ncbi:MAG: muconolactone Delta-isomerase family protein [Saprospiraceae bacterium]
MKKQFMVEMELPEVFDEKLIALVPKQRSVVNQMLAKGKIKSYSLSMDRSMLWAIFVAESEFAVLEMIAEFPLADHMTPYITELMFTNTENQVLQFSLN